MGSKYTGSQKNASMKYLKEKTDDIRIRVPKGTKEKWKKFADASGQSLTRYICNCVSNGIKESQSSHFQVMQSQNPEIFDELVDYTIDNISVDSFETQQAFFARILDEYTRNDSDSERFCTLATNEFINSLIAFSVLYTLKYLATKRIINVSCFDDVYTLYEKFCDTCKMRLYSASWNLSEIDDEDEIDSDDIDS